METRVRFCVVASVVMLAVVLLSQGPSILPTKALGVLDVDPFYVYLPQIRRSAGPPPAPVLDAIGNPDGDGNYAVSWSTVSGATSYILEEDTLASFSNPVVVYSGPGTSQSIDGQSTGSNNYRVRASNAFGSGNWSGARWVAVTSESVEPEAGHYTGTPSLSFDVTAGGQVCNLEITVPFLGGTCRIRPDGCATIIDNEFFFRKEHPVFVMPYYEITGTFDSRTHATGTYAVWICGSGLTVTPSEGTWEASK